MNATQPYLDEQFAPETPDLAEWDVVLLNSSGGKDSQTMIRRVVTLADEQGVSRDNLVVVHAALGRAEWKGTLELVREQAKAYGLECRIVKREQGDLLDHIERRGKFPGPGPRYCTSDHKRGPIRRVVTALHRERRGTVRKPFSLLNCVGIRAQESSARRKRAVMRINTDYSTQSRRVMEWLPIHDWTEEQVWADIQESGLRYHGAYDLGMPRLSCVFCIFAPKSALMLAGKHNPELLDQYVEIEQRIGHNFKADLSLVEVRNAIHSGEPIGVQSGKWNM